MADRPFAESAARNAPAILEVLRREFRACSDVLEIGSGTGQHAVKFAATLEHVSWQTSDLPENHPGIQAWLADSALANVRAPLSIDVRSARVEAASYDGVYSCNTAHIMSFDAVTDMFSLAGKALRQGGSFCLYGPFRMDGSFNTASNENFAASLRARDPAMGIRDLEALDALGASNGMERRSLYAMPSNNSIAVWQKMAGSSQ